VPFCAYTDLGQVNPSGDSPLYVRPAAVPLAADSCPGGNFYMVLSSADVGTMLDANGGTLSMTAADGALISSSILLLWAIAWATRQIARALNTDTASS
jgi:hypothetical protein